MDPSSSRQPTGDRSDRSDLRRNAVLFLTDPKVQSSTLASKIGFLESKGLTEGEIQDALRQASTSVRAADDGGAARGQAEFATRGYGTGTGYAAGYGTGYGVMPPEPPRRDWRDLFIMAVISGGVLYGLTSLARKYLLPHLRPPSSTAFQQTSSDLTAQYDEAARLLSELQTQTEALQAGLEGERERVRVAVEDVEEAVRGVREGEERWREEMREIRGEVESVRELVPRLIEKHAAAQSTSLSELQSELRSLKTLLQSRQAALSSNTSPGGPPRASSPHANGSAQGAATPGAGASETQRAANALLAPKGKGKGIPAWQMAGPDKAKDTATTPSVSGSTSLSASVSEESSASLAGSGVLPDKSDE
ncbi:peroxisomal membrane protein pex14 [Saitozyma podzolica]|uniref:Peroxisomal membrane protein PEX14 n=1 Tax=Saitozyma podzolica TaxID=1890683 RepID=A0A427Y7K7_9TREE|nr:peroxisomal membrane protein pex14 [Saitozyma podzolica]